MPEKPTGKTGLSGEMKLKTDKTYSGELMKKGRVGESAVMRWLEALRKQNKLRDFIDVREYRINQRLDTDFVIEYVDGKLELAEVKTDSYLATSKNYIFELHRINHFVSPDRVFYLGWAFRSPAKYLFFYDPGNKNIHRFLFTDIRSKIGTYVDKARPTLRPVPTDKQKTTYNILIPKTEFRNLVKVVNIAWALGEN